MSALAHRTPQEPVTDEYRAMVEWWLEGKTPKFIEQRVPVPFHPS
jgi:hypothetical protein